MKKKHVSQTGERSMRYFIRLSVTRLIRTTLKCDETVLLQQTNAFPSCHHRAAVVRTRTVWCGVSSDQRRRRRRRSVDDKLMEQPPDGCEQVGQTEAQSQHGDGDGHQHGVVVGAAGARPHAEQLLVAIAAAVVVVPLVPVGPTQPPVVRVVLRVRVAGLVVRVRVVVTGGRPVAVVVALEHAHLHGVQELDAPASERRRGRRPAVPPPHQQAPVPFVQHPFRRRLLAAVVTAVGGGHLLLVLLRRGRRGRHVDGGRGTSVAAADRLEQHVVQHAHGGHGGPVV